MTVKILNDKQKSEIIAARSKGETLSFIANRYNVSPDTISRVLKETAAALKNVGIRQISFDGCVSEFIEEVNQAIEDECLFSIQILKHVDSKYNVDLQDALYGEYYEADSNSTIEEIYDVLSEAVTDFIDGSITQEELSDMAFGKSVGFSHRVDIVDEHKTAPIPLSPLQQHEEAYARAIKSEPFAPGSAKVEAPEPIWNASSKFISITVGRDVYNADKDHPAFKEALGLLVAGDIHGAVDLINVERAVTRFVDGDIRIEDGQLFFKDIELKTGLTDRIIGLMYEGKDFKFLLPFLHNLLENPSRKAVYRLFDFLEANDIEITKEGYFIAWKKVRSNFHDVYTGTMDNSPGKEVRVERNQVDEDDERTCSQGLHVCSKSYLGHFGSSSRGDKVVSVLVHPKDVVSIPVDYNNAKMRTAGYKVIAEVTSRFD